MHRNVPTTELINRSSRETLPPALAPSNTDAEGGDGPAPTAQEQTHPLTASVQSDEHQAEQASRLEVLTQESASIEGQDTARSPDLLFVHGAWHGAWCWARTQALCASLGVRSHAVNLRGHGNSSATTPIARIRLDDYVADVAQVASDLSTPFVLVGHSLGGVVAQRYLALLDQGAEYPKPAAVILLASALPADMAAMFRNPRVAAEYGGRLGCLGMLLRARLTGDMTAVVATPTLVRSLFFTFDSPTQTVLDCFMQLQNESVTVMSDVRRFARIWQSPSACRVPTLVLGGEQDACCDPVAVKRLATTYGASLDIFLGMGHDLMLDRGWEQVAHAMADWVRSLPSPAADGEPSTRPEARAHVFPLRALPTTYSPAHGVPVDLSSGRIGRPDTARLNRGRDRSDECPPRGCA